MPKGVEKTSGDRRGNRYRETSKCGKRQINCSPVQVLYYTCKEVFGNCGPGIVPSPDKIQRLRDVMDGMTPADVGLRPNMQIFKAQKKEKFPSITYIQIYECDKFSIGLFCLPPSAVIPLHNHPEMTVFCKLLFGTMYVNSFDWVNANTSPDGNPPNKDGVISAGPLSIAKSAKMDSEFIAPSSDGVLSAGTLRLAKTKVDSKISAPCNTSVLYPTDGGNLHSFTALTSCAFLDVLGPPYCDPEGRHCTYYRKYPYPGLSGVGMISVPEEERQGYAWLEEREKPEGSLLYGKPYTGPKIVTK